MRKVYWIAALGIAFGLVEAAVVVYLRSIGEFQGIAITGVRLPEDILHTEIIREGATIVILAAAAWLAGMTPLSRLGAFLTLFGLWDLSYYAWLKVFLGWPRGILDGDILFLIPAAWAGPVLAPMMVSLAFIGCGGWTFWREESGRPVKTRPVDWIVQSSAALVIITSFLISDIVPGAQPGPDYISYFPWWLFLAGLLGAVGFFVWRALRQ